MAQPDFTLRAANGGLDNAIVVSFRGSEAISSCYRFDVLVKIPDSEVIDLDAVLDADVTFGITFNGTTHRRHGILQSFEMQHTAGGYSYYAASLVPHAWRLSLYPTNEVFVGPDFLTVDQIIDTVLTRGGFSSGTGFDISGLTATYPERQYTCQFGETDLAFISRLMERDGIWYHFEQSDSADMLVLRDDADYPALPGDAVNFATHPDDNNRYNSINAWVCRKQRLPNEVVLRDYNYLQPSLDVSGTATVDANGQGSVFIYGENFETAEEGARLARVRADELACRKTVFHGESAVPAFAAGYSFSLTGHPGQGGAWNDRNYLLIAVTHEGENLDNPVGATKNAPRYTNTFSAIPADVQFRPERVTPKPRFDGTMTAIVYSENAGSALAEVNETGHYRVRLPFDRANSDGTKASHWIRMAQPYAGEDQGMYFPLKANTEVLLTFINGDPDRPVIAGAVPNGAGISLLTSETANQATIATPDLLKLQAAGGAHSNIATTRYLADNGGDRNVPPGGPAFNELNPANATLKKAMTVAEENGGNFIVDRSYGDTYHYGEGNTYAWGAESAFNFGNDYEELHEGIDYVDDPNAAAVPGRYTLTQYTGAYVDDPTKEIFEIPILGKDREKNEGLIEKNWGNKLEYHYGSSYNWAGGPGPGGSRPEYNYGNGYTENLLEKVRGTFASEYASTKHDLWKSESRIDATKAAIEKTYGATYSYQNGFSYEIREGDTKSESWGDTDETVHGDSDEMVYGDNSTTVHGNSNEMVMGGVNEMFLGGKNEMSLSASNSMALGIANELFVGAMVETSIAGKMVFTIGATNEFKLGSHVEFEGSAAVKTRLTEIKTTLTTLDTYTTALKTVATGIETAATKIKTGISSIDLSGLKFW